MEININNDFNNDHQVKLNNNSIESPPPEIITQGIQSVLDWFQATRVKLNEIKIILIGEPDAGKTSLLKRLKDDSYNEKEEPTDGVNIEDMEFGKCGTFEKQSTLHDITGHFWDFGGQEIMNATHQFFLTRRSIYVLVLVARRDVDIADQIRKWVRRVRATGGDSPIIVVANKIDQNDGFGFVNEPELQNEFPQIKYFEKISCKNNTDIDLLKDRLEELIPTADLFKTEIDEKWILVKNKLREETRENYYLNKSRFVEICTEFKLNGNNEQKNALNVLHDLGLVLHFESLNLDDYYVMNPYWITYGAYQILTSKYAGENKGIVAEKKLEYIVNEEGDKNIIYKPVNYKKIKYWPNEIRFLTDILHEFKLCFWTPDRSHFIIPDLLDTKEPLEVTMPIKQSGERIQFVYDYEYLPKSFMPNIMVEAHNIVKNMWRTGCVLKQNDCEALVTSYINRISITVTGEYKKKREFMAVVLYVINSINQKHKGKIKKLVPLPEIDEYVDYEELLERERNGEKDHTVFIPLKKTFEISLLLEGIPSSDEIKNMKEMTDKLTEMSGKLDELLDSSDEISRKIDKLLDNSLKRISEIESAIKVSAEISSDKQEEIIKELRRIKTLLKDPKCKNSIRETVHNILCGLVSNSSYEIIKNTIKDILHVLLSNQ